MDAENFACPTNWGLKPAILDGPSEGQIPSIEVQTHTLLFQMIALGVWLSSNRSRHKKCTPLALENRTFNPISSSPKKQNRHLSVANESFFSDSPPKKNKTSLQRNISPTCFHANPPGRNKKIPPWESVHREVSRSVEGRTGPRPSASEFFPSHPPINFEIILGWRESRGEASQCKYTENVILYSWKLYK